MIRHEGAVRTVRAPFLSGGPPHLPLLPQVPDPTMRTLFAPLALSAALLIGGAGAQAHSALTGSDPAAGGTVSAGGFPVELRFNGRVDAGRSRLVLNAADGSSRKLEAKPGNTPSSVTARVEAVPPGPCALRYDVLSSDGHLTSGTITFTAVER